MGAKGVSPVIATVLLIVVTVMLVSVIAVVAMGLLGKMTIPVVVNLSVDYAMGENRVRITSFGPDNLTDAFRATGATGGSGIDLNNLIIRADGRPPSKITLNDNDNFTKSSFEAGDYLDVEFSKPLSFRSVISIVWKPTNQVLRYVQVA
jgi:flagellin-like protein